VAQAAEQSRALSESKLGMLMHGWLAERLLLATGLKWAERNTRMHQQASMHAGNQQPLLGGYLVNYWKEE
jgi:hypothetical protein